ncbi:MAG: glycoside hydrolase family 127 protein [Verrucomicrobiae bacterium]|nr:glycoside hydrolase family 127 protein [Verrucomicrobiae bacterium]
MRTPLMHGSLAVFLLSATLIHSAAPQPVPFKTPDRLPDQFQPLSPAEVKLEGFLGERIQRNALSRLAKVDLEPLLAGFRQKPGSHPWIGEHIGKWMHAATLAWAYTGDAALRAKLDYAAAELIKTQEADGYLGTYTPDKRFGLYPGADWDVWSHKYCLMGLLTYYQYTGNAAALAASRKAADLLIATFPAKKSILAAGTHVGMAATSVLEPIVLLYRHTGEAKYLEFARYIVRSWDEPNGPRIIAALLKEGKVNKTANGKAYEMLSNLVGLCELARATGEAELLLPVEKAVQDIINTKMYLTGGMSQGEHFREDHYLPNGMGAHVSETCVSTTWVQLLWQMLRLKGEALYGRELERILYNHLAAAQRPDGEQWCYFTSLEGTKPYGPGINCCVSSGPRGMALAAQCAYFKTRDARGQESLFINLLEPGRVTTTVNGQAVTLDFASSYPEGGEFKVRVTASQPVVLGLQCRIPPWAAKDAAATARVVAPRLWRNGDSLTLLELPARPQQLIAGQHGNEGRAALAYGPFVLALDTALNPGLDSPNLLGLVDDRLQRRPGTLEFVAQVKSLRDPAPRPAVWVPFANAGATGGRFQVWLRAPGAALPEKVSLLAGARESRSRQGNVNGSIADEDPGSFVVTFDGTAKAEDWYALHAEQPVRFSRAVFAHGQNFHDGGWFDASAGKPRLQIQRTANGPWEEAAVFETYPATTATDHRGLKPGQTFSVQLAAPVQAVGVRVIGKPACGDNPKQAFSSCAELQVFEK